MGDRLDAIVGHWQACAERGRDVTRPVNALLWRWGDDPEIAEALAVSGPQAIRGAVERHLAHLRALDAAGTPAQRQAHRILAVLGTVTAIHGSPGPLEARLAWLDRKHYETPGTFEADVRAVERGIGTAAAAIRVLGARLEAMWATDDYAESERAEAEAMAAADAAHEARWGRGAA